MGATNDKIERSPVRASDPVVGAVAINYSSDQTFAQNPRGLHISTAGTLKVDFLDGSTVSLVLAVGVYPYAITKIYATGSSNAVGHVLL
jgi:hypothetical protein